MHNWYTQLYNETVFEVLREHRGDGEAVVFARSATVGGQKFPVHWGGDCSSTFESMAESLRGGLSLAASGFGFWSHDIGGFEGKPDPAVFKRWVPFGLLSSHSRLHGNQTYRVPWLFDEESVDVLRAFTRLKHRLMPYLFGAAVRAHAEGMPVMRPMAMDFPHDPACTYLEQQYMLGDSLLVAPVFDAGGEVRYYVPAGRWTRFRIGMPGPRGSALRPAHAAGEVIEGPRWVSETHGFDSVPLLVRPGSVVAVGAVEDRPDYEYADGVTLRLFELPDGVQTVSVPAPDGSTAATFAMVRSGSQVRAERIVGTGAWAIELVGAGEPLRVPATETSCAIG
jgi:alpha-D-xyloside xylohydrolase